MVQPNSLEVFQQHFHRALLQFVVVDAKVLPHITDTREIIVGHLNGTAKTRGWIAYANAVFKKWNVEGPSDVKLQAYHDLFQHREKEVAILWTLRAMLASCLESLFLVDRVAYLEEKGIDVQIMPLFDPVDSPRNMCIIAKKRM